MSKFAPKIIHFSVIAPLSSERLEYIKIWAKANPDYQVKLWFSEEYSIDKFVYLLNFEKDRIVQRFETDYTFSRNKKYFEIWSKINWYKKQKPQDTSYRDHVAKVIPIESQQRYQSFLAELDRLKQEVGSVSNIELSEFNLPLDNYESFMIKNSLNKSDSGLAEYLIGLKSLANEGGFYFTSSILPEINTALFAKRTLSGGNDPDSQNINSEELELLKIKLVLNKLSSSGEISIPHTAIDPDEFKSIPAETLNDIKSTIDGVNTNNIVSGLFSALGNVPVKEDQVLLGEQTTTSLNKPVALVTQPQSMLIKSAVKDLNLIFRLSYTETNTPTESKLIVNDKNKVRAALAKYYLDEKAPITKNEIDNIVDSSQLLVTSPYNEYKINSKLFGIDALKRVAKVCKVRAKTFELNRFEQYFADTPEQKKIIKSYEFNKYDIFGRANYDSLIVISIGSTNNVYATIESYYLNKRIAGKSALLSYDTTEQKLITEQDSLPSYIGENTKIAVFGHGPNSNTEPENITVGGLSPEQLATVLKQVIPDGIMVKKLSLMACSAARGFTGTDGIVTADQSFFIPELLRKMAQKNIFTKEATGVNRPVTLTMFSKKQYSFHWIKPDFTPLKQIKKMYVTKPEMKKYSFRLDDDGKTVSYNSKPGIAAYRPTAKVIIPNLPHQNRYPRLLLKNRESEHFSGNNYLYDNISNPIKQGMTETMSDGDRIVVTNINEMVILKLLKILKLSSEADSMTQWLDFIARHLPGEISTVKEQLDSFPTDAAKEAAFLRIKQRFESDNVFDFYNLDFTSVDGAAALNYRYDHESFKEIALQAQLPGCRSRRAPTSDIAVTPAPGKLPKPWGYSPARTPSFMLARITTLH